MLNWGCNSLFPPDFYSMFFNETLMVQKDVLPVCEGHSSFVMRFAKLHSVSVGFGVLSFLFMMSEISLS